MAEETPVPVPVPRFNTATLVLVIGYIFAILDPFLVAFGQYLQSHSAVVFTDSYMGILKQSVEGLAIAGFTYWHAR